ncbi:PREDICTED: pleckstrin homology domain-containing family M member 3-like [Acropora digitifera]|uniref:pleckstrin homology domain-containing family M member 3-like n=1 Tax=Acropora digitifera TaxID=70779 RepID=UPI00077A4201|nr:PREDICTED: pleckstrin homology domain-containing family M member 3-like [Acropora digitifera]
MIYGEFKVCTYDACYYCFECHQSEEHIIPARVLHNWDLRKHQVSKQCKLFLLQIEEEPLFNIDETNPTLYNVIKELHKVKLLRLQLQNLKGFVFTCKDTIAEEVRRRMWPREYLWDDIHQYSLLDLTQVQSGQLAQHLKKIIAHCTKHVYKCKLCCQKGFFCEICNSPKIIYPFEVKTTTQCNKCKAVYHKACIITRACPKCIRRRKQQSAHTETPAILEFDVPW